MDIILETVHLRITWPKSQQSDVDGSKSDRQSETTTALKKKLHFYLSGNSTVVVYPLSQYHRYIIVLRETTRFYEQNIGILFKKKTTMFRTIPATNVIKTIRIFEQCK